MMKKATPRTRRDTPVKVFGNDALWTKVKAAILAHPERYDQSSFCGTACCIAGHVVAQAGLPLQQVTYQDPWGHATKLKRTSWREVFQKNLQDYDILIDGYEYAGEFAKAAADALGLDWYDVHALFGSAECWPGTFKDAYINAQTPLDRAKVAVARIDYFRMVGE